MLYGTGIYLTRLVLWNIFGLEKFIISNRKVEYYCDFKLFKSKKITLVDNKLSATYLINEHNNGKEEIGYLVIESSSDKIESQINLSIKDLDDLSNRINHLL